MPSPSKAASAAGSGRDASERPSGRAVGALWIAGAAMLTVGAGTIGLLSSTGRVAGPEHYASTLAAALPFGYAFAAGMVASVNPCGFLMLPAFVGYQLGDAAGGAVPFSPARLARALLVGGVVTAGFLLLFSTLGLAVSATGQALVGSFRWVGLAIGITMACWAVWLFARGGTAGLPLVGRMAVPSRERGLRAVFLYGIAYGAVSLSCTLPVFLVVVGTSLAAGGLGRAVGQFAGYALGMGVVVTAVSLAVASFQGAFTDALRSAVPHVHRASAVFLFGAGVYLVVYWAWLGGFAG